MCTKAASEMLIKHQLNTLQELVSEYGLVINITLVKSHENRAGQFTRVPQQWLDGFQKKKESIELACAATSNELESACIRNIHHVSGYPSVKYMLYFVKIVSPGVSKAAIREVVKNCDLCQSIDPAPVYWKIGRLDMHKHWSRGSIT